MGHSDFSQEYSFVRYVRVEFALGMPISCCLSRLCSRWVPNINTVSGGTWALHGNDLM